MTEQPAPVAAALPQSVRQRIFLYLGALIVLMAFGSPSGGLIEIPISFFLKNKLHLTAHELAQFRLVSGIPHYLAFVFGFIRDIWNPFGMKDRGLMMLFGAICAGLYGIFAFTPVTYATLMAAVLLLTTAFLFVSSAQNGLASTLGQQHAMTGQISAVWNIFGSIPTVAALLIGGYLSGMLDGRNADEAARILFLSGAALMIVLVLYAAWRPAVVFDNIHAEPVASASIADDIKRLARHWPIYPALLIWLLWNFAPGSTTPLQYYLQNTLHAADAQWGQWNAIFAASFIPTFLLFGILSPKLPLKTLLWWGTIVAIPQMVPLLFIELGDGCVDRGRPHGPDGRRCQRGLSRPDHSLMPARLAGHHADAVGQPVLHRVAVWRRVRHLSLRHLRQLHGLRDCDHRRLCPDPAGADAGAGRSDRHRRRAGAEDQARNLIPVTPR